MNHEGWSTVPLAQILSQVTRPETVTPEADYKLLGVRWYGNGCHVHCTEQGSRLRTPILHRIMADDVTYNKMWVTKGAFAVVQNSLDGVFATSEYPTFVTKKSQADPAFLRWAFRSPAFIERASSVCRGTTSRARLNPADFLRLTLPLPPLGEQRKIAALLSSMEEVLEATQSVIDQLEALKKAVMAELLTRGLPGRHAPLERAQIGDIPDGWRLTTVGELGQFRGGNGFRPRDWATKGLPIIRIQNLNGSTEFNYYAGSPQPGWLVEPGELLFAWAGSRGASFGPCIWPGPRGVLNQHIHRIAPSSHVRKMYLYYVLRLLTEAVEKKAHGFKDTLVHLRKGELTGWPVYRPALRTMVRPAVRS